jgi:hypothetical protein
MAVNNRRRPIAAATSRYGNANFNPSMIFDTLRKKSSPVSFP